MFKFIKSIIKPKFDKLFILAKSIKFTCRLLKISIRYNTVPEGVPKGELDSLKKLGRNERVKPIVSRYLLLLNYIQLSDSDNPNDKILK